MKSIACLFLLSLLLLSFAAPGMTAAGPGGASANGDFQFSLIDGELRYIQFDVRTQKNGETKGQMTFNDPAAVEGTDGDAAGATNSPAGLFVSAEFDCLQVRG